MANSRVITSAIWEDEWFGPLGFFEQALWIGLFSKCADDQGRFLDNAILIRAAVFPYKDVNVEKIDAALAVFEAAGRLYRYEADGKRLIQMLNWWTHQPQQWASASKWPAPDGWIDHVRTRQSGQYLEENWRGKSENALDNVDWSPTQVSASPEAVGEPSSMGPQVGGHIPIPIPIPDPVPDPGVHEGDPPAPSPEADAPTAAPKRRRSRADPRTKLPAIQCVKGILGGRKLPPVELYDDIVRILGPTPDGEKLARCRQEWVRRGYNPQAWTWLTEWYVGGIPEPQRQASRASPSRARLPPNAGRPEYEDPAVYQRAVEAYERGDTG